MCEFTLGEHPGLTLAEERSSGVITGPRISEIQAREERMATEIDLNLCCESADCINKGRSICEVTPNIEANFRSGQTVVNSVT